MYTHIYFIIALMLTAVCSTQTLAQQKFERESRLKVQDVPFEAVAFIDSLAPGVKIKWYLEEGLDRSSIEAKFKLNDKQYSIEFDTTGTLEDIEILLPWSKIEKEARKAIETQLTKDCVRFKIRKIQIQHSGEAQILLSDVKTGKPSGETTIRYELVIKCRSAGEVALYEYLFSGTGQLLTRARIIFKNSSNLEY